LLPEKSLNLMAVSIRVGNRALPLAWTVASGTANIGFEGQLPILEQVFAWLPKGVKVMDALSRPILSFREVI
jgi:hypothetical protein